MSGFFEELKRRNIFKVGLAYLAMTWLVLQVGSLLAGSMELPPLLMNVVIFFTIVGFPFVLVFAWAFELTPSGLKRAEEVLPEESVAKQTGRKLDFTIMAVMAVVIVLLVVDRFVVEVKEESSTQTLSGTLPAERSYESIAVLPFVNMSGDPDQEFFSDGISEELLNLLARTKGLRVAARTSSFAFKNMNTDITDIGDKLNVETVLEGSVRKADTRLRITAQLIDVASGYHLWSQTYDRELTDIFAVQDEISAAIVRALAIHFGGEIQVAATTQGGSVEAYEEYLMGRELIGLRTKESIEEAAVHFDKAMEIDPEFAPAWAGKADTLILLSDSPGAYGDIPQKYAHEFAGTLIDRAIELDPGLADPYSSRAFILSEEGRLKEAMVNFDRALDLRPNFAIALMWQATVLEDTRRWKEAHEALEKAHRIDPLSSVIIYNLAMFRSHLGDIEGVDALVEKMQLIAPENLARQWITGATAREIEGDISEAWRLTNQAFEATGEARYRRYLDTYAFDLRNLAEADRNAAPAKQITNYFLQGEIGRAREAHGNMDPSWQTSDAGIWSRVNIEMWAGNFVAANDVIDTMLRDLDLAPDGPLFKDSFDVFDRVVPYIRIKQVIGDGDAASRALSSIEDFLRICREDETFFSCHQLDAAVLTFKGDPDGAVAAVERALKAHNLNWSARNHPVFDALADRADFQAVFDRFDEHINKERADLGWGPMETVQ